MIKGVGKKIILLNNTDSELFEQAIFILRSGKAMTSNEIVKECERMINTHIKPPKSSSKINKWKSGFFVLLFISVASIIFLLLK